MAEQLRAVVDGLRSLVSRQEWQALSDAELLGCFIETNNGDAFSCLMRRHGPMVLGLARRVLREQQLAEDVFQATFLVLARKAKSIRGRESLPAWLHSVALRLANRAKKSRQAFVQQQTAAAGKCTSPDPLDELTVREFLAILDEELSKLPQKYRLPLILCHLEGLSQEKAAKRLGVSASSIKWTLERGRVLLRQRLARRGLPSGAALAGSLWYSSVTQAASPTLVQTTLHAALTYQGASAAAVALAEGAIMMMTIAKIKTVCLAMLILGVVAVGAGWVVIGGGHEPQEELNGGFKPALNAQGPPQPQEKKNAVDLYGDPLPPGAVARLGSLWFRHGTYVSGLAFSADSKTLISTGSDRTIRFWDLNTAKSVRAIKLEGTAGTNIGTRLSPDGQMFVGWDQKAITLWDTETGKQLRQLPAPSWVKQNGFLFFSLDGQTLAAGDSDLYQVKLWQLKDGKETAIKIPRAGGPVHVGSDTHASLSPDGKMIVVGLAGPGQPLKVLDVATGQVLYSIDAKATVSRFSPNGKLLVVASRDKEHADFITTLCLYESSTGKEVRQIPLSGNTFGGLYWQIAFSPDSKLIIPVNTQGIYLRDSDTGQELRRFGDLKAGGQHGITASPDGRFLASARDGQIHLWELDTGKELHQRPGAEEPSGVAYSANGCLLAIGPWVGPTLSTWDTATGKLVHLLKSTQENAYVLYLSFAADEQTLIVGNKDGHLDSFDTASGRLLRTLVLPDNEYRLYSLSADGHRAVTANRDFRLDGFSTIKVWETNPIKLLATQTFNAVPRKSWGDLGQRAAFITPDGIVIAGDAARQFPEAKPKPAVGRDGKFVEVGSGGGELFRLLVPGTWSAPLAASPDRQLIAALAKTQPGQAGSKSNAIAIHVWEILTGKEVAKLPTGPIDYMALASDGRTLVTVDSVSIRMWDIATGKVRYNISFPEEFAVPGDGLFVRGLFLSPDGRLATTALRDGTLLVWSLPPWIPPSGPAKEQIGNDELTRLWKDLASQHGGIGYAAVLKLADAPESGLPLLRKHLTPVVQAPAEITAPLLADLANDSFAMREAANKQLKELGFLAEPALLEHLKTNPPLEARQRIESLLKGLAENPPALTQEDLRNLRAVAVLSRIRSPQAREILENLAKGVVSAPLTTAAKAALGS